MSNSEENTSLYIRSLEEEPEEPTPEEPSIPDILGSIPGFNEFLLTPGTDLFPYLSTKPDRTVVGRNGNDVLLLYDAVSPPSNASAVHTMIGDRQEGRGAEPGEDTFILGDWRRPYYNDASTVNSGRAQYAIIPDFQPQLDTIRLHGNAANYFLSQSGNDTEIFLGQPGINEDLIAKVSNVSGLSLDADYFQFAGTSAPSPSFSAIKQGGTIGLDEATSVAPAPDNGVFAAGYTSGSLASGSNGAFLDGWLARYDSQGNKLWSKQIGTGSWETVWDLDSDSEGNVYLLQFQRGSAFLPVFDVSVSKYNSQGTELWTKELNQFDASLRLDVAPDGSSFAVSGVNIGADWNALVGKYDADGNNLWFNRVGSPILFDESYAVSIDDQGNVFAAGWTYGNVGGLSRGLYDVWLAKFDSEGNQLWADQLGSRGFEFAWAIDNDSAGNAYVGGWTSGNLGQALLPPYDGFLAKYDANGNQEWLKTIGANGDDQITNLIVGEDEHIYVTGFTNGDFGGANTGIYDTFVAKYNPQGNRVWLQKFGSEGIDHPRGITVDSSHVYVSGVTDSSLGAFNQGSYDGWVGKLDIVTGNLVNFNGNTASTLPSL